MLLLELTEWIIEHWGEVSISALLLFILRKLVMNELHRLLHFGRDEELEWTRQKVEELTGEKWSGPQPFLKHIQTHYSKTYSSSSRKVIQLEHQLRRKTKMNTQNINWTTLVPCLLGAAKLILQPIGINIPDENLNEIANGIAALATVIGIIMSHKKQTTPQTPDSKNFIQG